MSREILIVIVLMLALIGLCLGGALWDQHLTIDAQDQTIKMLQTGKCMDKIAT